MGISSGSRNLTVVGSGTAPATGKGLDQRIADYSALAPVEFKALFADHSHADLEMDVMLEVLQEFQENPENRFTEVDRRSDSFQLHLTVGLPRSGKSTMVKDMGFPVMNPDTIRLIYHGERFLLEGELNVWDIAARVVDRFRTRGEENLFIDATNTNAARRDFWLKNYSGKLEVLRTPVDVCIRRAIDTGQQDLIPVIKSMAASWDLDDTYKDIKGEIDNSL